MTTFRPLIALSFAAFIAACAGPGAMSAAPAAPGMDHAGGSMPMAAMEPRMKAMKDMHHKMMNAKTPAERQALMAEHMKAMQDGMAMMKEMHGGMQGMQGMGGMGEGKAMPADMAKRHQMMTDHMAMMQMMMDMMMQRMPPMAAAQ
jgi:hypothetical protein